MEARFYSLTIIFESVETEPFYVEFSSYPDCVDFLVRKILSYYGHFNPIRSSSVDPVDVPTPSCSLMDSSYADLFNFLIH